jgi:O-antigen/teichoic acid export membrane protein
LLRPAMSAEPQDGTAFDDGVPEIGLNGPTPDEDGPPGVDGSSVLGEAAPLADVAGPPTEPSAESGLAGSDGGLRALTVRGGAYLVLREGAGMLVRLGGVVLVLRLIGPSEYGFYSAASAFVLFITTLSQMGAEVYLVRQPKEVAESLYAQAFTFLLVTSITISLLGLAASFAVAPFVHAGNAVDEFRVLLLSVPVNVLWAPAQARIEREFGYRRMGMLELSGDVVLYATAVSLALAHAGAWSLVFGFIAWQTWLFIGSLLLSGLRPRLNWSMATNRELLRHGLSFSASKWIASLMGVVSPVVVGGFWGASAVGYVAFAQRLVDTLGFASRGAYRLGLVAMSRIAPSDTRRIRRGIEEGTLLQLLALGVPFALFALVARLVIPLLFGTAWSPAIGIYSLLTLACLLNAGGAIQTTTLFARGNNARCAIGFGIQAAVLAVVAAILVPWLGITGFGLASIAALAYLLYVDRQVRQIAAFDYRKSIPFALALGSAVLFPIPNWPFDLLLLIPLALLAAIPTTRSETIAITRSILRTLRTKVEVDGDDSLRPRWSGRRGNDPMEAIGKA